MIVNGIVTPECEYAVDQLRNSMQYDSIFIGYNYPDAQVQIHAYIGTYRADTFDKYYRKLVSYTIDGKAIVA